MIALGIESSNSRGMGHLFRALLYVAYLREKREDFLFLINDDDTAKHVLQERGVPYLLVDYSDTHSGWEKDLIRQNGITCWFNDKFDTSAEMGSHIKEAGISLALIDDVGAGEKYADAVFLGMLCTGNRSYTCSRVYRGTEYVVLNPEIMKYRRKRVDAKKIVVCLGGSDTYGATVGVAEELKKSGIKADIVIGPDFRFKEELEKVNNGSYKVFQNVPSLIELFSRYDLAITGGGVTCCEAMASGLPCAVIANEDHEAENGRYFEEKGCCIYLGTHKDWRKGGIERLKDLDVAAMSCRGMESFRFDAIEHIFTEVLTLGRE